MKTHCGGEANEGIFLTDSKGFIFTGVLGRNLGYQGLQVDQREYFQKARSSGKTVVGNVVRSKATDQLTTVICAPIVSDSSEFLGTVGIVVKVDFLVDLISGSKVGETGYGFLTAKDGLMLAHPNEKFILELNISTVSGMRNLPEKCSLVKAVRMNIPIKVQTRLQDMRL
ncbi:cache domain-containing protein [Desulfopila inferna]|uniref:cache domain-containing protein n=1 Tax=Desulfopila inferna TaxID=468528 RepID=UPI0019649FEE|nr:cache domain-containing protein [Desulfopila inferna]MBM9604342.1 cache domain-containing protein [Desulfopila inferna]